MATPVVDCIINDLCNGVAFQGGIAEIIMSEKVVVEAHSVAMVADQ